MAAQKGQAGVLLHRLHYALPGWDAAGERRGAQGEFHSAAGLTAASVRTTALLSAARAARLIRAGARPQRGGGGGCARLYVLKPPHHKTSSPYRLKLIRHTWTLDFILYTPAPTGGSKRDGGLTRRGAGWQRQQRSWPLLLAGTNTKQLTLTPGPNIPGSSCHRAPPSKWTEAGARCCRGAPGPLLGPPAGAQQQGVASSALCECGGVPPRASDAKV
jgi:hypothetical protein